MSSAKDRAAELRALTIDLALDGHLDQAAKAAALAEAIAASEEETDE